MIDPRQSTIDIIKAKYGPLKSLPERAAESVLKGAYSSQIEGDVTWESEAELQSLAALLASLEAVQNPYERQRMLREWCKA
ncbi:hypothetical protein EGJ52_04125 [Pseudomonas luteola]|uniref:hypothetical protein n=1 Tax=Pseudomonas luteola TaxID=47886 RepID=UPI000F79179D|nr:hypothetical protein [Pseudomonas luteola]MCG7372090.1 hypothetical protein [Pseudomonas luteola]RRW46558.1 hypothetical protein EGJ52_04125 [Pseudomonas luteola]